MRTLVLYHSDWIQDLKADLIASRFPVDAFVQVEQRRQPAVEYLKRRLKRFGLKKVTDETLWRLWTRVAEHPEDERQMRRIVADLRAKIPASYQVPPVHKLSNINSPEGEKLIRELKPDVCIILLNVMLKKHIFSIPRHGMLIFHPGVVPEYRGVHCGFWAVANDDIGNIGWSLLRIDEGVDTGPLLAQGRATSIDPSRESYAVMQHKAQFDGMAEICATLQRLADGETPRLEVTGRTSVNYTHPGISDYLRYRRVLAKYRRKGITQPLPDGQS